MMQTVVSCEVDDSQCNGGKDVQRFASVQPTYYYFMLPSSNVDAVNVLRTVVEQSCSEGAAYLHEALGP